MYSAECCGLKYAVSEGQWVECPKCGASITHKPLNGNKESGAKLPCSDLLKGRLIKAAASLATNRLSELDHDYPERFPKWVLREIEKHNDRLRLMTLEIRDIANSL